MKRLAVEPSTIKWDCIASCRCGSLLLISPTSATMSADIKRAPSTLGTVHTLCTADSDEELGSTYRAAAGVAINHADDFDDNNAAEESRPVSRRSRWMAVGALLVLAAIVALAVGASTRIKGDDADVEEAPPTMMEPGDTTTTTTITDHHITITNEDDASLNEQQLPEDDENLFDMEIEVRLHNLICKNVIHNITLQIIVCTLYLMSHVPSPDAAYRNRQ